jgi:hypothetical protein
LEDDINLVLNILRADGANKYDYLDYPANNYLPVQDDNKKFAKGDLGSHPENFSLQD